MCDIQGEGCTHQIIIQMADCFKCGKKLHQDEVAIYKRIVNRGATEFLCAACLAEKFKVPEEMIYEKIEHFRRQGCTLFSTGNEK